MDKNLFIFKTERNKNYKTISLNIYDDNRLSWKAKGLHTYLISRPDDWQIYRQDLLNKATDGSTSLNSAVRELIDYNYMELETGKTEKNRFYSHYIVYEVPKLPQDVPQLVSRTGRPAPGNQHYSNKNNNKEVIKELFTNVNNLPARLANNSDIVKIFNYYSQSIDKIKYILHSSEKDLKSFNILTKHKNLNSKCTISLPKDKEKAVALPLIDIIEEYLSVDTAENLITALDNYVTVFISNSMNEDIYWYKITWKSLGQFIYSGLRHNTGYKAFLDINKLKKGFNKELTILDKLRIEFIPISKIWDEKNILDKDRNTYYGFETKELKFLSIIDDDIKDLLTNTQELQLFGYFEKLERAIAALLFNRKGLGIDIGKFTRLMNLWNNEKNRWKKIANKIKTGG